MNKKFRIENSIYIIGTFIAIVGMLFLIARSDAVLKYRYFNESAREAVLQQVVDGNQKIPTYLMLTGPDETALGKSLEKRLKLMGKKVVIRPISSIESETELMGYAGVVVATEKLDLLKETDAMLRYVESGGTLFQAVRPSPGPALSTLYQPLGLVEAGDYTETSGIQLEQPFFGENGDTVFSSETITNSSLSVRLSDSAELFASSSSGIPLLWKSLHGEGVFIVFNGTMFESMTDQALFVQGIQQSSGHVIMPVINARVTELNGFPFFVPEGNDLSASFTNRDYYRKIVWPELQRIESKYDLDYTASYQAPENVALSAEKESPVLDELWLYSRELLRMGGEIAVQEPMMEKVEQVSNSVEDSVLHIQETLPDYPIRSIVSTSSEANVDLMEGVSAVLVPDTDIKKVKEAILLPKTIEGFEITDSEKWRLYNEVASSGYYAHSLHPYRFFEEGGAEEQLASFAGFQQSISNQLPWLRSLTLFKTAEGSYAYINSDLYEEQSGDTLTFYATAKKENTLSYYYFSTHRNIVKTENCEVEKIGHDLYLVAADELTFSIVLGGL